MEKTLKDLFVPYEIALLAKQYGFDEFCLAAYYNDNDSSLHTWGIKNTLIKPSDTPKSIIAPLYQQLFDWLEMRGYLIRKYHTCVRYEVIDIDAGIILKSVSIEELNDLLTEVITYTPRK